MQVDQLDLTDSKEVSIHISECSFLLLKYPWIVLQDRPQLGNKIIFTYFKILKPYKITFLIKLERKWNSTAEKNWEIHKYVESLFNNFKEANHKKSWSGEHR